MLQAVDDNVESWQKTEEDDVFVKGERGGGGGWR